MRKVINSRKKYTHRQFYNMSVVPALCYYHSLGKATETYERRIRVLAERTIKLKRILEDTHYYFSLYFILVRLSGGLLCVKSLKRMTSTNTRFSEKYTNTIKELVDTQALLGSLQSPKYQRKPLTFSELEDMIGI